MKVKIFETVNQKIHSVGRGYVYIDILYIHMFVSVLTCVRMFIYLSKVCVCFGPVIAHLETLGPF